VLYVKHSLRQKFSTWLTVLALLACLSLFLSLCENRLLWGHWIAPPTVSEAFGCIDNLRAISSFSSRGSGSALQLEPREDNLRRARYFCGIAGHECIEGQLLLALERKARLEAAPEVRAGTIALAEKLLHGHLWRPRVRDPKYKALGAHSFGWIVNFSCPAAEYVVIAYRTGEIANDRHAYAEALVEIRGGSWRLVRQVHYYFDIAGIEGLTWHLLWPLNALVLFLGYLLFRLFSLVGRLVKRSKQVQ
jgi:hypothetical protein